MRKIISYLCAFIAFAALVLMIYLAMPLYPYINDRRVFATGMVFLLFYYLAYRTSKPKKDRELT